MARKLKIAIDCRISDPCQGIGTAVLALAKALSESRTTSQEYTFIVRESMMDWLTPYISGPCQLKGVPASRFSVVKRALKWCAPLRLLWKRYGGIASHVPVSDGYVESQQFDVVHFPTQIAYLTELPTIYQPHDLQHLHYPQFFPKVEFARREKQYRAFCDRAAYVVVHAEWTKQDVINHYEIAPERIVVIPWGSVFDAYNSPSPEETRATIAKYELPSHFFFYPAVTWPHKNHEVIFRALNILKKEHAITPHVFFTGSSTDHRPTLDKLARDLGVSEQLHFLGFVTPTELQVIFRVATAMIYSSRFEGFGLPILEAFHAGLPVLSSNASTLPEVARDGAVYFDPDSPRELSALVKAILDTPELRENLIKNGMMILPKYSINKVAANFQTLYERTAALHSQDPQELQVPTTM